MWHEHVCSGLSSITISPSSNPTGIINFLGFGVCLTCPISLILQTTQMPHGECRLSAVYPGATNWPIPCSISLPCCITLSTFFPLLFQQTAQTISREIVWDGIFNLKIWKRNNVIIKRWGVFCKCMCVFCCTWQNGGQKTFLHGRADALPLQNQLGKILVFNSSEWVIHITKQ